MMNDRKCPECGGPLNDLGVAEETPLALDGLQGDNVLHADNDRFGRIRIWITLRDKSGKTVKGNRTRTITVQSTVGEILRRVELSLFGPRRGR